MQCMMMMLMMECPALCCSGEQEEDLDDNARDKEWREHYTSFLRRILDEKKPVFW